MTIAAGTRLGSYGDRPRWRADGRELYYQDRDGQAMAVEIATTPEFKAGKPEPLGFAFAVWVNSVGWDASADGRRFLLVTPKSNRPEPYTVTLNWQAGLKK
jgi:hypothetical protein